MCLDCGCGIAGDDHGDPRHITIGDLAAAADASGVSPMQAAINILTTLQLATPPQDVAKNADGEEQRFLLGVAYQAGVDAKITKGKDGARDCISPVELEKAAWGFMLDGQQHGLFHVDGTLGAARPVESYIYRNPVPWVAGPDLVVKQGDWVLGALCDDFAWQLYKDGKVGGWSPQGLARRRKRAA